MPKIHCSSCGKNHYYDYGESSFRCPYCGEIYLLGDFKMIFKIIVGIMILLLLGKLGCFKGSSANGTVIDRENHNQIQGQKQYKQLDEKQLKEIEERKKALDEQYLKYLKER